MDKSNPEYSGYYKFGDDPAWFKKLVDEISPDFFNTAKTKKKIKVALKNLSQDQTGSTLH